MHKGRSPDLRWAALGPVPTSATQEQNLAPKIVSLVPTQNLREKGRKAKQLSGTRENNVSTRTNTFPSKSWTLKALELSTTHSSGPIPAFGSRSGWHLNSALPPREKMKCTPSHQTGLSHEIHSSFTARMKLLPDQSPDPCAHFAFSGPFSTSMFIFPTWVKLTLPLLLSAYYSWDCSEKSQDFEKK